MNEEVLKKLLEAEGCNILLNAPDQFDYLLKGNDLIPALPSNADLTIATKHNATQSGRAAVVISWTCSEDGIKFRRAQYSTTIRLFKSLLRVLDAKYDDDGMPRT